MRIYSEHVADKAVLDDTNNRLANLEEQDNKTMSTVEKHSIALVVLSILNMIVFTLIYMLITNQL